MNHAATFSKGDRVRLSALGLARLHRNIGGKTNGQQLKAATSGIVGANPTQAQIWAGEILVIPDGRKSERRVQAAFWEKVPARVTKAA